LVGGCGVGGEEGYGLFEASGRGDDDYESGVSKRDCDSDFTAGI
jgi:hypothetical protein